MTPELERKLRSGALEMLTSAHTTGGGAEPGTGTDLHAVHAFAVNTESHEQNSVLIVLPDLTGLYGVLGGVME